MTTSKNSANVRVCGRTVCIELLEPAKDVQTVAVASPADSVAASYAEEIDANECVGANETESESEDDQFASFEAEQMDELKSYLMDRVVHDTGFDEDEPINSADILGSNQMEEQCFDDGRVVDELLCNWSCEAFEVPGRKWLQVQDMAM